MCPTRLASAILSGRARGEAATSVSVTQASHGNQGTMRTLGEPKQNLVPSLEPKERF